MANQDAASTKDILKFLGLRSEITAQELGSKEPDEEFFSDTPPIKDVTDAVDLGAVDYRSIEVATLWAAAAAGQGLIGNVVYDAAKKAVRRFLLRKQESPKDSLTEREAIALGNYIAELYRGARGLSLVCRFENVGAFMDHSDWVLTYRRIINENLHKRSAKKATSRPSGFLIARIDSRRPYVTRAAILDSDIVQDRWHTIPNFPSRRRKRKAANDH